MKVRMLTSQLSSPDGIGVVHYKAGEKYTVPDALARAWILQGTAEEDKDMGYAPEIKDDADYGEEWPWGGTDKNVIVEDKPKKKKGK